MYTSLQREMFIHTAQETRLKVGSGGGGGGSYEAYASWQFTVCVD